MNHLDSLPTEQLEKLEAFERKAMAKTLTFADVLTAMATARSNVKGQCVSIEVFRECSRVVEQEMRDRAARQILTNEKGDPIPNKYTVEAILLIVKALLPAEPVTGRFTRISSLDNGASLTKFWFLGPSLNVYFKRNSQQVNWAFFRMINPPNGFSDEDRPMLENIQTLLDSIDELQFTRFKNVSSKTVRSYHPEMNQFLIDYAIMAMTTSSLFSIEFSTAVGSMESSCLHTRNAFVDLGISSKV